MNEYGPRGKIRICVLKEVHSTLALLLPTPAAKSILASIGSSSITRKGAKLLTCDTKPDFQQNFLNLAESLFLVNKVIDPALFNNKSKNIFSFKVTKI